MSIHIIIDGYNLIRQSDSFGVLDRQDIQLGRDALLDTLAEYQRIKRHMITVVFDGTNAPPFSQLKNRVKGIKVKFSRSGESADSLIKQMANKEREKALVVSSDMDIVNFAAKRGAATISSADFEEKIAVTVYTDTKEMEREEGGWVPTTKKKGPSKRLSKRKRRNRIKIKKL